MPLSPSLKNRIFSGKEKIMEKGEACRVDVLIECKELLYWMSKKMFKNTDLLRT
jgi:hypothetical protein